MQEAAHSMEAIGFSYYQADEVRAMSVKRITSPRLLDGLGKPVPNGLYDPALGPTEQSDVCPTCGDMQLFCPGHFGHIELVMPVFNPLLYRSLVRIFKSVCVFCHHFKHERKKVEDACIALTQIMKESVVENPSGGRKMLITSGHFIQVKKIIEDFFKLPRTKCSSCGGQVPALRSEGHGKLFQQPLSSRHMSANMVSGHIFRDQNAAAAAMDASVPESKGKRPKADKFAKNSSIQAVGYFSAPKILLPSEVRKHLSALWRNEEKLCSLIWGGVGTGKSPSPARKDGLSLFFLEALAVTPNRFRPPNYVNNQLLEHPQNKLYEVVVEKNIQLSDLITESGAKSEDGLRLWLELQNAVNELIDSTTGIFVSMMSYLQSFRFLCVAVAGKDRNVGIRQLLEKKQGLFRWNMMGKRVNHTCRSVISPDPFIAVNEIGIPPNFAVKLTYPEKVTAYNFERLRRNVENGPNVHPGATHVEDELGVRVSLEYLKDWQRVATAKTLLSTPGATATDTIKKEKLIGKTVYRHLQDGDILLANRQPTLHKPGVMGHKARVIKGQRALRLHYANCSTYNADFDGDEMNVHFPQDELGRAEAYLIVNANQQYIVPTSGEPIRGLIQDHIISATLLTKKDTFLTKEEYHQLVYSACVPMPTLESATFSKGRNVKTLDNHPAIETVPPAIWKPRCLWSGKQVLTTILNYVTRGRPPFSMERGIRVSGDYIGKTSEELKVLVRGNDFLCGIIDKAQFGKFGLVHTVQELYGADDAGHLLSVFSRLFTSYLFMHGFTCGIADMLLLPGAEEERAAKLEPAENELGDIVHGRFVGVEDKQLSSVGIEAIKDMTGRILQLRADAGRARLDMLMSSAMNKVTSEVNNALFPKGLVKPFPENCLSLMTVTGAKGGMVNFTQISSMLGQQELEGKRVPRMVSGKTLPCFQPYEPVARSGGFIKDRFLTGLRPQEYYYHCMAGRDGLVDTAVKTAKSGYLQRCIIKNLECLKINYDFTVRDADGSVIQFFYGEDAVDVTKSSCLTNFDLMATNRDLITQKLGLGEHAKDVKNMKAIVSKDAYITDIPEAMEQKFEKFMGGLSEEKKKAYKLYRRRHIKELRSVMTHKYFASLAAPGEPVGVLAGQSIGEPSTQMTLNTFHFAGRGEMNVTLGIPRLHEILTVASKAIKTPIMTCPLKPGKTRDEGQKLAGVMTKVMLPDILETVEVSAVPFYVHHGVPSRLYKVRLRVYPEEHMAIKSVFAKGVRKEIEREIKALTSAKDSIQILGISEDEPSPAGEGEIEGGKKKVVEAGEVAEEDDDDDDQEEGADAEKRKGRTTDEAAYETDSEQEDEQEMDLDAENDIADGDNDEEKGGEVVDDEEEGHGKEKEGKKSSSVRARGRSYEMKFQANQNSPQLFLPNIVEKVLKTVTVRRMKNIEKCNTIELNGKPENPALQTDGVNFWELWSLPDDVLDLNKLTSNDIAAMLNTYGVEAARATIVREVQGVFGSYGISVNARHLSLIADFMTFQGGYRPLNRVGIVSNPSPFLKMSFETASQFLIDASLRRQVDELDTPSSRIIVGRTVGLGTGCFDLLQKTDMPQY
ncbi:hypothetical protein SELMODRAFT_233747 [Selaginella moellendorffii]|uniref:DNA-directed RNA polymerase subunit n=1 Tax=Selaginella moellendorffii TaxID=88036 RepID=D8SDS6_SELML|nr:hypothetical protein SELMODRAFT_233747 [Selaginella moellendorffii]